VPPEPAPPAPPEPTLKLTSYAVNQAFHVGYYDAVVTKAQLSINPDEFGRARWGLQADLGNALVVYMDIRLRALDPQHVPELGLLDEKGKVLAAALFESDALRPNSVLKFDFRFAMMESNGWGWAYTSFASFATFPANGHAILLVPGVGYGEESTRFDMFAGDTNAASAATSAAIVPLTYEPEPEKAR
jgi:hypothetical protein